MRRVTLLVLTLSLLAGAAWGRGFATGRLDPFSDVPRRHWARRAIEHLRKKGILEGWHDRKFHGKKRFTRYEMAVVFARILERLEKKVKSKGSLDITDRAAVASLSDELRNELDLIGRRYTTLSRDLVLTKRILGNVIATTTINKVRITNLERINKNLVTTTSLNKVRLDQLEQRVSTLGGTEHPSPLYAPPRTTMRRNVSPATRPRAPKDLAEARRLLFETIDKVQSGDLPPEKARSIGFLCHYLLKSFQSDDHIREVAREVLNEERN